LPPEGSAAGFSKTGLGPDVRNPFDIQTGFLHRERYPTTWDPFYWFDKYFLHGEWQEMLSSIRIQGLGIGLTDEDLESRWQKLNLIELFMGVHCLPEEIDYFTHFKGGMSVLEFYFGENFLTYQDFVESKKVFRVPRKEFTIKFNSMMSTIYVPERYRGQFIFL